MASITMSPLNTIVPAAVPSVFSPEIPLGKVRVPSRGSIRLLKSGLAMPNISTRRMSQCKTGVSLAHKMASTGAMCRMGSASAICALAVNARCSTEQQTIQHQSAVITNAPAQNKEKSPELDDGGTGFPPRDDGDGGGGGGGGGGWKGGFFFFGFLAFLGFLKDKESEGSYEDR
ncbi:uncharacterized protein LOC18433513 [Amborella trichopoda]|uniref:Uncharacterized protein n=1 Tax=Amborella trichopoda TaxID=13333 RepID=W1P647_AMBTC|nr:uncharacterized protein LOC18433513 [Amborella trichopoda]ERN05337.1 hypothetical protein AMTR_s00007p00184720 [Amborella trichopoda]|eukprot:XP_006843662.1 uncharacterized protein LOC18433513 [Amborella trichopoda]